MNEGAMPSAKKAKEPQVTELMERLSSGLARLELAVGDLGSSLSPVLRLPGPSLPQTDEVASELVPLADELRSRESKIVSLTDLVRDILERLEL